MTNPPRPPSTSVGTRPCGGCPSARCPSLRGPRAGNGIRSARASIRSGREGRGCAINRQLAAVIRIPSPWRAGKGRARRRQPRAPPAPPRAAPRRPAPNRAAAGPALPAGILPHRSRRTSETRSDHVAERAPESGSISTPATGGDLGDRVLARPATDSRQCPIADRGEESPAIRPSAAPRPSSPFQTSGPSGVSEETAAPWAALSDGRRRSCPSTWRWMRASRLVARIGLAK